MRSTWKLRNFDCSERAPKRISIWDNKNSNVYNAVDQGSDMVQPGILWTYGYNHEEAVTCFERAIDADPQCAMAHWGAGYAFLNYNMPWDLFEIDAGLRQIK